MDLFEYVSAKLLMASGMSGQNGVHAAHRVAMELGPGHEAVPMKNLVKENRFTNYHVICNHVVSPRVFFSQI